MQLVHVLEGAKAEQGGCSAGGKRFVSSGVKMHEKQTCMDGRSPIYKEPRQAKPSEQTYRRYAIGLLELRTGGLQAPR